VVDVVSTTREVFVLLAKKQRRVPIGRRQDETEYPKITLSQALDFVLEAKRAAGLRERTLRDYGKNYNYFCKWLNAYHPEIQIVSDITAGIVRDYLNYLRYDAKRYDGHKYINADNQRIGLSDVTVNIRLRTLKAIFNQLKRDDLIEINPLDKVSFLRTDIDLTNCLSDDEVKAILSQPNQRDFVGFRDYVAMCLMLDSGLRVNELLGLRAGDIDFQTRFITLQGDKTKNRRPRIIPFSSHVSKLLIQLISENKQHFSTDRVFLSCYGEPLGANQFNKRLKYYAQKAGVTGKKLTAHVWRHTWAKNMVLSGSDPFTLQKMGGWQDIRTVRRYIQMDTADIRQSHDLHSPIEKFVRKRV